MFRRLFSFFLREKLDRELTEEIETHLAMQEDIFRRQGMSAEAARAAARREFGGVAHTMESYRERRGIPWLESTLADIRYALRGFRRNPAFAAAAVLSLALGIGANTAVFSLYHALMLRLLPVEKPQELVSVFRTGGWGRGYASYPLFLEIRKQTGLFQDVAARTGVEKVRMMRGAGGSIETAQLERVSGNYFRLLGVAPAIGRVFTDDDNRTPGAHPLVILGYDLWKSRFGGDPNILGSTLTVAEHLLTIIGVAAKGFHGVEVERHTDLWEPAMMESGQIMDPGMNWVWILGRRRPGVSAARIQAALDVFFRQYLSGLYGQTANSAFRRTALAQRLEIRDGAIGLSILRDQFGTALTVLMAAVGLVLLASCANVANLLLARGAARRKEVALRVSLGGWRLRLIRQAFTESLLLALAGAVLGTVLAEWGAYGILAFLPAGSGGGGLAPAGGVVLGFTAAVSILSAVLFGLAPALRSTAVDPAEWLRAGAPASVRQPGLRRALAVLQVAFSVVLVAVAVGFGSALSAVRAIDPGFRNQSLVSFSLDFPKSWKPADTAAVRRRLIDRIEALPRVTLVTYGFPGPFLGGYSRMSVEVPGSPAITQEPQWVAAQNIGPRYFEILGSPLRAGREFDRADFTAKPKAAIVNEAFVRQYLPGDPHVLGRAISVQKDNAFSIVGIVRDMRHEGLRQKPGPTIYLPLAIESIAWEPTLLIRSDLPAAALASVVRAELAKLGPQIAFSEPKTIRQAIDESIYRERLLATLGGCFGLLALALAAIGLYGVVAYGTERRAAEIGIRVALGARRASVVWMVLQDALLLVAGGLLLGLPLSLIAGRRISELPVSVPAADAGTLGVTAALLAAVALIAALLPARRAATLDPTRVLRSE